MANRNGDKAAPLNQLMGPDGRLPGHVRAEVESHIEIAKAFAVTMALFAAVQISFAQIIANVKEETGSKAKWDALYIFTYGSIILNLGGSAGAITVLYQITALENRARKKHTIPTNISSRPNRGMSADWNLLREYGIPKQYKGYYTVLIGFFCMGCIFIFVSFSIWLRIAFRPAVYGTLIPFAGFALLFSLSFMFLFKQ